MIQVLKRADSILNLLGKGGNVPFGKIVQHTGLKKTTLSNILKALLGLEYICRTPAGSYALGPGLLKLAGQTIRRDAVLLLAEEQSRALAQATQEAAVITMYDGGEMVMVAKAIYDRGVIVNTSVFRTYSAFTTATGRVLLAYLPAAELKSFIQRKGLPPQAREDMRTAASLKKVLARIQKDGIEIKPVRDGEVQALAVPLYGADGKVWAALGVYLPKERFKGSHRTQIIKHLKQAGKEVSNLLKHPASL